MHKSIILIPPCFTYGDCLSVIGMLNYLLKYYKLDKEIYFHVWARNRSWETENMMLDKAPKMMEYPRLSNWKFINE